MLSHLEKYWRSYFIAVVVVAATGGVIWFSDAFQQCMNQSYYESSDYEPEKGIAQIFVTFRWTKACTGEFLKVDGEAITAFFTLVVGLSTAALWLSTRGLWKVTNATLAHAERASVRELRAYVSVKEISMDQFRGPSRISASVSMIIPGEVRSYRISAMLENGGPTPIRNALVNINHVFRAGDLPEAFDYPDGEKTESAAMGARGLFHTPGFFVTISDVRTVIAKANRLFVWGWIDYDDVFEDSPRRRTEFCFEVEADERPRGDDIYMRFYPYGRFNGADGDCLRKPRPHKDREGQRSSPSAPTQSAAATKTSIV